MLHRLLKQSDWSFLLDFVSPAFFKIIPPLELAGQATALAKRTKNQNLYGTLIQNFSLGDELTLVASGMKHDVATQSDPLLSALSKEMRSQLARLIVDIYFAQLYSGQHVLLDLRLGRFRLNDGRWIWSPAPLIGEFHTEFLDAMCRLYEGFYFDNQALMLEALTELELEWAYDTFIHHFGEGDQSCVEFKISHFVQTFHDIFMSCKERKKSLRGDFVQLGVTLGLMYDSLEKLEVPVDVRSSFRKIHAKNFADKKNH